MKNEGLLLMGRIVELSRGGLYVDRQERVTLQVHGAEPLYAELRLPNNRSWTIGQELLISIVPARSRRVQEVVSDVPNGTRRGSDHREQDQSILKQRERSG